MWKKTEAEPMPPQPTPQRPVPPNPASRELATIGASISIKGDLSGDEDLIIQGKLEGKVVLKQHNVTVGRSGRVKADIYGRSIRIEGEVEGNLYGEEDVVIRASGRVQGNLVAPRVTLENGSKFKGSIDMETAQAAAKKEAEAAKPIAAAAGRPPSSAGDAGADQRPPKPSAPPSPPGAEQRRA